MGTAVVVLEVLLVTIVVAAVLFLVWLFVRRRWLSSRGGLFDCALRHPTRDRWLLGMARYDGDELEWYKVFSLNVVPNLSVHRRRAEWQGRRAPSAEEAMVLFTDHEVVTLDTVDRKHRARRLELAMTPASATGLMSWLEASAPGAGMSYADDN